MTATAGPGISLMAEFTGLAYYAEVPAVIWDIQRVGPSTGLPTRTSQGDILFTAFLGHGDTKHIMLLPASPLECFTMAHDAFDLAEQFQTPVFVMSDLDLGMNNWMADPFEYPDKPIHRGKVLSKEELDKLGGFARYKDVDGDGIPYRTYPGTHPKRGSYFTRGTSRDRYARYTEDGATYVDNMQRLLRKFESAKKYLPAPVRRNAASAARFGAIYFGSTGPVMDETLGALAAQGIQVDTLRVRAFPFHDSVADFIGEHEQVFVVEQNRDAQLRSMLVNELFVDPARLIPVLHYDGTPITARFIAREISDKLAMFNVTPIRKVAP